MTSEKQENFLIHPSATICGQVEVLGDKSISHRAIIFASIAKGQSQIKNCLLGEDNLATLKAFNQMGVKSKIIDDNTLIIEGVGLHGLKPPNEIIDLGNSGTAIRLLTGLLSAQKFKSSLSGDDSILKRPMARVTEPLSQMGAKIELCDGNFPPIKIEPSELKGSEINLKVPSAQVKSAILLAALYAEGETKIHFSETTRDHTELMMQYFGINFKASAKDQKTIAICQQNQLFKAKNIEVVGDFSSASFLIAAALLGGGTGQKLIIKNVGVNPTRTSALEIMKMMGADIELINQSVQCNEKIADIRVSQSNLIGIEIPKHLISNAIDEMPVLMVLAAFAKGRTVLKNAIELRYKESDRIKSVIENLKLLGVDCEEYPDGMSVQGLDFSSKSTGATISLDSFSDHRIAMAFSLAALKIKQSIEIKNCQNVNTSFPSFVPMMKELGLNISKTHSNDQS